MSEEQLKKIKVEEDASCILINSFLDKKQTYCLNQDADHPLSHLFIEDNENKHYYLQSECDSQLLIMVGFRLPMKMHFIKLKVLEEKLNQAPKTIHLFINQPHLDFLNVESDKPIQSFELDQKDYQNTEDPKLLSTTLQLKLVSFGKLLQLGIFIKDNLSGDPDEPTLIQNLDFFGVSTKKSQKIDLTED